MDEGLIVDAIGLAVSLGVWLSGVILHLRAQAVAVSRLPASWRFHPELREGLRVTAELRVRDLSRQSKSLMIWFGVLTGYSAALGVLDVPLWGTLLLGGVYAFYSSTREVSLARDAQSRRATSLDLPKKPSDRPLAVQYFLSLLLGRMGFYLASIFAGYLLLNLTGR